MFTVIRVYSMKEEGFVAVVAEGKVLRRFSGVSEFTVAEVLQVSGAEVVIGSSMPKSLFARQYRVA